MKPTREIGFVFLVVLGVTGVAFALLGAPGEGSLDGTAGSGEYPRDNGARPSGRGGYGGRSSGSFVNWESPHVHPLDITPDQQRLLAVNTADNRLEVFRILPTGLVAESSIPVGLDPVSVRAHSDQRAWVVNHVSDSVSIVDLDARNVIATITTKDEPADVVFAGPAGFAFVTCSQADVVQVYDHEVPSPNLIAEIPIRGQDPRALAVSPDGQTVYAAIFESGNGSTLINGQNPITFTIPSGVDSIHSPYFNPQLPQSFGTNPPNPPPNSADGFNPPLNPASPAPPPMSLIVKKDADGKWVDDRNKNWSNIVNGPNASESGRPVGWDLPDRDVAFIDATSFTVTYAKRLMNMCGGLAVHPSGRIAVVGTDGTNEIRFEPNLKGIFNRVKIGLIAEGMPSSTSVRDLNPHLDYTTHSIPPDLRTQSLGDPRGVIFSPDGDVGYVSGMGSNNVIVIVPDGARASGINTIPVGEGPTGLAIRHDLAELYVLNRFEGSITTIDTNTRSVKALTSFFDPTPSQIRVGRKFLYNTHLTSGLGQASCASCHLDSRFDRLAWDLGDPSADIDPNGPLDQNLGAGIVNLTTGFAPWHSMKGPMVTQTLQDIIGHEPHHWRGDRDGIEEFNQAFVGLLGDDAPLHPEEMQQFEDYLATITFPPNPFRLFNNRLPTNLPLPGHFASGNFAGTGGLPAGAPLPNGNAEAGLDLFINRPDICFGTFSCVQCHTMPTGMGTDHVFGSGPSLMFHPFPIGPLGENHRMLTSVDAQSNITMKTPQLRNMYEKTGCDFTHTDNTAGFGFAHDGSIDSLERFLGASIFIINNDQEVADLTAFMLAFSGSDLPNGTLTNMADPPGGASRDTHAAVGRQTTLVSISSPLPGQIDLIHRMMTLADSGRVGLVVKGLVGGFQRGYVYLPGGTFRSDRAGESLSVDEMLNSAQPGGEITFTVVPRGTEVRIGIDRDEDGILDFDENGTQTCVADFDDGSFTGTPDGGVTIEDLLYYLFIFDLGVIQADIDDGSFTNTHDGGVTIDDLLYYLFRFDLGC